MPVNNQKGTPPQTSLSQQIIVNFCYTVLRSDDDRLREAIQMYQQSLPAANCH